MVNTPFSVPYGQHTLSVIEHLPCTRSGAKPAKKTVTRQTTDRDQFFGIQRFFSTDTALK
jgi:hypothetical protein